MYYTNYGYPQGCSYPQQTNNGFSWGGILAFILVIFILLVVIGGNFGQQGNSCSKCQYSCC